MHLAIARLMWAVIPIVAILDGAVKSAPFSHVDDSNEGCLPPKRQLSVPPTQ